MGVGLREAQNVFFRSRDWFMFVLQAAMYVKRNKNNIETRGDRFKSGGVVPVSKSSKSTVIDERTMRLEAGMKQRDEEAEKRRGYRRREREVKVAQLLYFWPLIGVLFVGQRDSK